MGQHVRPQSLASPALSLQVCVEKWNLLNSSRLHLPRPSAVAPELERLNALDLEKKIGKSILGKVSRMPVSEPSARPQIPQLSPLR